MCFLSFFISQCNLLVRLWFTFTDMAESDSAHLDWLYKQCSVSAAQFSNSRPLLKCAEFKCSFFN